MTKKNYVPGRSIEDAREVSGLNEILKVGSNENVLGPSPKAVQAIRDELHSLHLYPGREEDVLLEKLADRIGGGLTKENFVTGNGSVDVLRMITKAYITPGKKALIGAPTFSMYELLTESFGGDPVFVPLKNFTMDLDGLANAVDDDVAVIFVCNPNNPTGTFVKHEEVAAFLDRIPEEILVVFDEAYVEFVDDPAFPRILEFIHAGYNVLSTRTFSKLYGLAGLRIGYGFGRAELMERVRQYKMPFNSSRLAYVGAAAALEDDAFVQRSVAMAQNGRAYYYQALQEIGVGYMPTQTNFIFLTDLPLDANEICDEAMKKGIILRPTTPFGLPDNIRITIARRHENERVVNALGEILAKAREQ